MPFDVAGRKFQVKELSSFKLIEMGGRLRDECGENKGVLLHLLKEKKKWSLKF